MLEFMPLILFAAICIVLMFGFPVALSLAGTALLFAGMGKPLVLMPILIVATLPPCRTGSTAL